MSHADESPFAGKVYLADSARDRCLVRDCLCSVRPGPAPEPVTSTRNVSRAGSVYFSHNSDELTIDQQQSVSAWLSRVAVGSRSITVFSYTDGLGSAQYNHDLAYRRNQAVRAVLRATNSSLTVRTSIVGEAAEGYDPLSRRVDIIIHTTESLTTKIDKVRADVYLIDASGSMWGAYRNWSDVINASFRPGSRVFLSIMSGCRNGQRIDQVNPQNGTEIWYSYWKVLEGMQPGETLAIISDFQSNHPLSTRERAMIDARVREKNIRVVVIRP
tara:strand:- start:4338 stop:5153 length:816 start_codon:yes stop_codon:yes gene_type:complete